MTKFNYDGFPMGVRYPPFTPFKKMMFNNMIGDANRTYASIFGALKWLLILSVLAYLCKTGKISPMLKTVAKGFDFLADYFEK